MKPARKHRALWGCGACLAGGLVILFVLWSLRASLLKMAGEAWIKDERADGGADAIVVLGGGAETRPFRAAELFRAGVAPSVWVMQPELEPTAALELRQGGFDVTLGVLRKLGVPEPAIEVIGKNVSSTWEEALAVRDRVRSAPGVKRLVVPTDPFHTRRVDWIFTRVLQPEGVDVLVVPVKPLEYDPQTWWRDEDGCVAFHNEMLKYAVYRLRYARGSQ